MLKIWDISFATSEGLDSLEGNSVNGQCKESIIIKPDEKYQKLISAADNFKNELSRGVENLGAIKRQIFCSDMMSRNKQQNSFQQGEIDKLIALSDNAGIL